MLNVNFLPKFDVTYLDKLLNDDEFLNEYWKPKTCNTCTVIT
jgi:hypothetical protein